MIQVSRETRHSLFQQRVTLRTMFSQRGEYYGKIRDGRRCRLCVCFKMRALLTPIFQLTVALIVVLIVLTTGIVVLARQTGDNKIIRYSPLVHLSWGLYRLAQSIQQTVLWSGFPLDVSHIAGTTILLSTYTPDISVHGTKLIVPEAPTCSCVALDIACDLSRKVDWHVTSSFLRRQSGKLILFSLSFST